MDPKISELLTGNGANGATTVTSDKGIVWSAQAGASLSTSSPLYAPASLLLDNSGEYFRTLSQSPFQLGAGDFAVDVWGQTTLAQGTIVDADCDSGGFAIILDSGDSEARKFFWYSNGGDYVEVYLAPIYQNWIDGTPFHILVQRKSGVLSFWFNGFRASYADASSTYNYNVAPAEVNLGRRIAFPGSRPFVGKIGGLRVTVGGVRQDTLADLSAPFSPYDSTGGGSVGIIEATATLTADAGVSMVGGKTINTVATITADGQLSGDRQYLRGSVATINDDAGTVVANVPYVGNTSRHFATNLYRVPVSQRANLQSLVDTYKKVRLDAGRYDQGTGAPTKIILRSGCEIYGVPGTKGTWLPDVEFEPGSVNAVVKGVCTSGEYIFPASTTPTINPVIAMSSFGNVTAIGARIERAQLLSLAAGLRIDNSAGGWWRNCRIFRPRSHGAGGDGRAALLFKGTPDRQSYGNVVVAQNALSCSMAALEVDGHEGFSVVGFDEESYAPHGDGKGSVHVRNTGRFNIFGLGGAVDTTNAIDTGADDTFILYHDQNAFNANRIRFHSTALRAAFFKTDNSTPADLAPGGSLRVTEDGIFKLMSAGAYPASLLGVDALAAAGLLSSAMPSNSTPWGFPDERALPDPAGPSWQVGLGGQADDSAAVNALLAASDYVELQDRPYYITAGIQATRQGQMIVSGGPNCVLIGTSSTVDILKPTYGAFKDNNILAPIVLIDLVFQGGRHHYLQTEVDLMISDFYFVNCTFREPAAGAIFLNGTMAFDNGYFDNCNFYKCPFGIKQRKGAGAFDVATSAYIDKMNHFRSQFIECGLPLDFLADRPCNLDTFMDSLFRDSTVSAFQLFGMNYPAFINCQFLRNAGNVSLNSGLTRVILCGCLVVGVSGNNYLLGQQALAEGCTFQRGTSTANLIDFVPESGTERYLNNAGIVNCVSLDVPIGNVDTSPARLSLLTVNSSFPAVDSRWQKTISAISYDSKATPFLGDDVRSSQFGWLDAGVSPGTRFLRDYNVAPSSGSTGVDFKSSSIAGAIGALIQDAPLANVSGAIKAAQWQALADAAASFSTGALAAGEAEAIVNGVGDAFFIGTGLAGGSAAIDAIDAASWVSAVRIGADAVIDLTADVVGDYGVRRSGVAALVADAIAAWQTGLVPGSGGDPGNAPSLRTMARPAFGRVMPRQSNTRSMKR